MVGVIDNKTRKLSKKMLAQLEKEYLLTNECLAKLGEYRSALETRMAFVRGMIDE